MPSLSAVHAAPPPIAISAGFVVLVAILLVGCLGALRGARAASVALVGWLGLTGALGASGFLAHFESMPPRLMLVVVPAILACVAIASRRSIGPLLDGASTFWPIGFQVFRVALEILLWRLAGAGVIPVSMTFEGRNYDILVGLTAPFVAWLATRGWLSAGPTIFWNLFGLALLGNVVAIGFLSAPTPFRRYFEGPPNEVVAGFPFVWLPAFLVPVALLGHLLSIRQQWRRGRMPQRRAAVE